MPRRSQAEYYRKRYAEKVKQKLCPKCNRKTKGFTFCDQHRVKATNRIVKMRKLRVRDGKCARCGVNNQNGNWYCDDCKRTAKWKRCGII